MNKDVWKTIFKNYVANYEAIQRLSKKIIDEEDTDRLKAKLLDDIICTFRSEVED